MRTIRRSSAFKRDFKRILVIPKYRKNIDTLLVETLKMLSQDKPLPTKQKDHGLVGDWSEYRECHLKPNLLLVYSKPDDAILRLVRLGSHSDLFG